MSLLPHLPSRANLLADVRRMHEHATENRWADALAIAQRLEAACAPLDVKSGHLAWALAVLHDNLGDLERALTYIVKAVDLDPLGPATDDSLRIIADRVRKALATEPWNDTSPRLYSMLAENGLADAATHVAWATHLHATGRHEEALEVVRSVALLNPGCTSAFKVVETIALALGREDLAREASLRSKMAAREDPEDGWNTAKWGVA